MWKKPIGWYEFQKIKTILVYDKQINTLNLFYRVERHKKQY